MESIPKGMQMVIVSFCCCLFCFFIKNTKATPTPSSSCGPKPGSSCSSALLLPPAALRSRWQFELLFLFFFFVVETENVMI